MVLFCKNTHAYKMSFDSQISCLDLLKRFDFPCHSHYMYIVFKYHVFDIGYEGNISITITNMCIFILYNMSKRLKVLIRGNMSQGRNATFIFE